MDTILGTYELVINSGTTIAKIDNLGPKYKTLGYDEILQLEMNQGRAPIKELDFNLGTKIGLLTPTPDPTLPDRNQRDVLMLAGPSGAGKSTLAASYSRNYINTFPSNNIVIFSSVSSDEAYNHIFDDIKDKKKAMIRFVLDEQFKLNQLEKNKFSVTVEDLKDCLVIFDDTDTIADRETRQLVFDLREACLQTGRHQNLSMLVIVHQPMDYNRTRGLILESTSVTLFTKGSGKKNMMQFMKTYMSMDKNEVRRAMTLPGRWVTFGTGSPNYAMYQTGIYLL